MQKQLFEGEKIKFHFHTGLMKNPEKEGRMASLIINIYGPVTCSLCEKCVRKYRPKFSQNHMVRN